MRTIKPYFRSSYAGESVVTDLNFSQAKWNITSEFIGNSVINNQISNQACVIGNGVSRQGFNLGLVINHFGGLLKRSKLQTYGCNALYRDHSPDFLVVSGFDDGMVKEVANSGYCDTNVVYASASQIQSYPGKFYLIPQDPGWNAGSVAAYLAAFDGHTTVYLLGFDNYDTVGANYNMYAGTANYQGQSSAQVDPKFFELTMLNVFETYPNVNFIRVMPSIYSIMPESWKYVTNLTQIDFHAFILAADL